MWSLECVCRNTSPSEQVLDQAEKNIVRGFGQYHQAANQCISVSITTEYDNQCIREVQHLVSLSVRMRNASSPR